MTALSNTSQAYSHGTFSAKTLLKQDVGTVADDIVLKEDLDEEDELHLMHNSHNLSTLESKEIHKLAGRLFANHRHAVTLWYIQGEWKVSTRLLDAGRPSTHDSRDVD
jgi:hypothetical protein